LDNRSALTVEAAIIDAFPELTNLQLGLDSDYYGCRNAQEIKKLYEAKIADLSKVKAVVINIRKSLLEGLDIYDAARYHWKIKPEKAEAAGNVIAHDAGLIRGVFSDCRWQIDTDKVFTDLHKVRKALGDRYGFIGESAKEPTLKKLIGQRLDPAKFQKPGAANPIRYTF
jgi:hypothetical protein